jgi:hypothetical protein
MARVLGFVIALGTLLFATSASAQWRQNGIDWAATPHGSQTNPDPDCLGNCGAGCSNNINPCGGPPQYWELTFIAGPDYVGSRRWQECVDREVQPGSPPVGHWITYREDEYQAIGRWLYHGWYGTGCRAHDELCSNPVDPECAMWTGCGETYAQTWWYDEWMRGFTRTEEEVIRTEYPCHS